nr:hypothetical protein [uncultured Niameybacter sp.]
MRRQIAFMLSIVLLIGVFRGFPTFASPGVKVSEKLGFKELNIEVKDNKGTIIQKPQGIKYEQNKLQLVEGPLEDEVTMKWKFADETAPRNGVYNLNYYVEGGTSTNPKLYNVLFTYGVNVTGTNKVDVEIKVQDDKGKDVETKYVTYSAPYGDANILGTTTGVSSSHTLHLNESTIATDKELVVAIGNLSKAKMFIKDNEIYLSVTGIKKDYITPFTLTYDSKLVGMDVETDGFNAFKGIKEFQILPTHLIDKKDNDGITTNPNLKLPSQTVVDLDKVVAEGELGVEAGLRPGIAVTISKPKTLVTEGTPKFVPIDDSEIIKKNGVQQAEIYLEELLGKGADVTNPKQVKVKFDLEENSALIDTIDSEHKGKVVSNGDKFELYFVKDTSLEGLASEEDRDKLFEWPHLQEGMLINGEVAFGGKLFGEETKSLRFKPDKVGYTYVRYTIYRLTADDISFKVEPYNIRGPVSYTLLKEGLLGVGWDAVDVRHYQDKPITELITLTTKKGAYENYKIIMNTGSDKGEFESQIVKYNGKNDIVPPPYSEIINVDNVYVIPDDFTKPDSTTTDIAAVGLDLEWRAPDKDKLLNYLQEGTIYYELYLSDSSDKVGKPIKVFKVNLDGKDIKLENYAGTVKGDMYYDTSRGSFIAQGVVLKDQSSDLNEWEVLKIPEYEGLTKYPEKETIIQKNEAKYEVPNTYYLTVRPVYDKNNDAKVGISKYSNPKSVSLDVVRKVVPTPETIQSKPLKDNEERLIQGIYFSPVDLSSYVKYMLDPLGLQLKPLVPSDKENEENKYYRTYEIYLYQNTPDGGTTEKLPFDKIKETPYIKDDKGNISLELTQDQKTFMREQNGALLINYDSTSNALIGEKSLHELIVKGLEPNTPYYVQIRTRIDLYKGETALGKSVYSVFSKIHSFTTETKPVPPTTDEQVPPAPEKFFIDSQPSNTTVKLGWEESEFALNHKDNIYYEMLRSDGATMDEKDSSRMLGIEKVLGMSSRYQGFHTADQYIKTYKAGSWVELEPKQGSGFLRLEENNLLPNTVYYYYIRTVYKVGEEKVYSDWIMLPVTTAPVSQPIDLKVEPRSVYKYDGQHEVVISFLAPIPKGSKVPEEFDFDIALKGEKDEDYKLDYSKTFIKEEDAGKEYRRFFYKIKGLTHGTRYDIKVRVVDKTKEEIGYSLYSDKITARTDFSEADQDKENAFNKYLEIYDREAEKLKRKPYWVVDSSSSEGIYKYRQSYIQSELATFKTYELVTKEEARSMYYYVPSTFFEEALKSNTLVTIQLDDYKATLRPSLLKDNEDIKEAREKVKEGKYDDFYIGIHFYLTNLTGKIQGEYVISPEITMDLEIKYLDKEDQLIEDSIMDDLNGLIDDGREEVVEDLEDEIVDGKIDEKTLNHIIEKALTKVVDKHEVKVEKILDKAIKKDADIYDIQKSIYVEATLESYEAKAYYYNWSRWEEVYTYNVGGILAFEMDKLGSYAFVGSKGGSSLVPDIPGGSSLISKYNLTDFFDVEKGLNQTITKEKLYGAVARVLGARRGTDYTLYLKDRGIKLIVPNTLYQPVRQDEAIYIVMQAYEKMYYKNINSIYISNKLKVENIGAFQPIYRPYVYGAVELGIAVPEGNKVLPSKLITAKDVVRMLSKIAPK